MTIRFLKDFQTRKWTIIEKKKECQKQDEMEMKEIEVPKIIIMITEKNLTFPQATLALKEYSDIAIFSSTIWSAKLSGLPTSRKKKKISLNVGRLSRNVEMFLKKDWLTHEPLLQQKPQLNELPV